MLFPQLIASVVAAPVSSAPFDRIFVITLENQSYKTATSNPYLGQLAQKGRLLTDYHGVTHPSQPNYISMIAGNTKGVFLDFDSTLKQATIVDQFESKGISWKSYQQSYPGNCFTGGSSGTYRRKHNPFISFSAITGDANRCAKIVNADQLQTDIANNAVPQYVFYTPDMNNDGHDTDIRYASNWLQGFIEPLLVNPVFSKTLFVVTFDENDNQLDFFGNQVYTVLLGPGFTPGSTDNTKYNHYSLLATVVKAWGLTGIDNDKKATPFF
ncbi:phosphoesterase [Gorgonomyces haynaldii]|nr:phosphoesterase [Gorgonomyces haynaldii]